MWLESKFAATLIGLLSLVLSAGFGLWTTGSTPMVQSAATQAVLLGPGSLVPPPPVAGTIENLSYVCTENHNQKRQAVVYLPPDYTYVMSRGMRFPTIYLLHGAPGDGTDWIKGANAPKVAEERMVAGTIRDAILVMPMAPHGATWPEWLYLNKWNGTDNEEDCFINDLVPTVDATYRTIQDPHYRAIIGVSEGGYAAPLFVLRHRNLFDTFVSLSGYFTFQDSAPGSPHLYRENYSPEWVARQYPAEANGVNALLIHATLDFPTGAFAADLKADGGLVEDHQYTGVHDWFFWSAHLPEALTFCNASWGQ